MQNFILKLLNFDHILFNVHENSQNFPNLTHNAKIDLIVLCNLVLT